ncbi:STAS domain-containing protein [Asticcacaulis benevestitus]|uniref:STAS domain-containing protein n=1 Tax=Asticcacaulis benevestitus TaxID=347481 RepID=UPI00039C8246|nr:STAS domain-containing protein [Asticcacaulis benevestitus]
MKTQKISLAAIIDTVATHDLKSELLIPYRAGTALSLDASAVERIGTPGLQLLRSAANSFEGAGFAFTITAPSHAFLSALKDAALDGANTVRTDAGTL